MRSEPQPSSVGLSEAVREADVRIPAPSRKEQRPALKVETVPVEKSPETEAEWNAFLPDRAGSTSWKAQQLLKSVADRLLAGVGLLFLTPLFLVVALAVIVTSRGPIFYACEYVGFRGRRFRGYKFRTMVQNAEEMKAELEHLNHMKGPAFKIRRDPRITRIGRFLRKFSIDELPQLWNVVKGDMSLVGPRPPLPEEYADFKPWQRGKLSVIPGITCFWQVRGRSEIVDFDTWAKMDLQYIEEWNLWTDLKVLLQTIPAVLLGTGAY